MNLFFAIVLVSSKNAKEGSAMSNEDEFFAEMHPQIAQVIGIAVMQLLVEKREPSREALIEMIQVLWQGDQAPNGRLSNT